jgi:TetR/AcrR family tetracycline transcriptional repressor
MSHDQTVTVGGDSRKWVDERLTEERVLAAARDIIRRTGVGSLSMRGLAAELGVTQMAPYHYVRTKKDLLGLVVESVLESVPIPDRDSAPWDERLTKLMTSMIQTVAQYPGLGEVMVTNPSGPALVTLMQAHLEILGDAGFAPDAAMLAFSSIYSYVVGRLHTLGDVAPTGLLPVTRDLAGDQLAFGVRTVVDGLRVSPSVTRPGGGS